MLGAFPEIPPEVRRKRFQQMVMGKCIFGAGLGILACALGASLLPLTILNGQTLANASEMLRVISIPTALISALLFGQKRF